MSCWRTKVRGAVLVGLIAPWVATTSFSQAQTGGFYDGLVNGMGSGWIWLGEEASGWRTTSQGLEVRSDRGFGIYESDNTPRNLAVRPIDLSRGPVDISLTADVDSPSPGIQGGLVLYNDGDNYVKLVIERITDPNKVLLVMLREEDGVVDHHHDVDLDTPGDDEIRVDFGAAPNEDRHALDLRLTYNNGTVAAFWKEPGAQEWIAINETMALPDSGGQWYAGILTMWGTGNPGSQWHTYRDFRGSGGGLASGTTGPDPDDEMLIFQRDGIVDSASGFVIDKPPTFNGNLVSPNNFAEGTLYFKVLIRDIPTEIPDMRIKWNIWSNPGESWSDTHTCSGVDGFLTEFTVPMTPMGEKDGGIDFTKPRESWGIHFTKGNWPPIANYWNWAEGAHTKADLFPLDIKIMVVAVVKGGVFSGWQNYWDGVVEPEAPAPPDLDRLLVAHYTLDSDAQDATSNALDGTIVGASPTSGVIGGAYSFDGTGQKITVAHSDKISFATGDGFSLALWANPTQLPDAWTGVVAKSREVGDWYGIWIDGNNRWVLGGANNVVGSVASTEWTHVSAVQSDGVRKLFVDGVLVGSGPAQRATGSGELCLGSSQVAGEHFDGVLDDVRVYARALSTQEIQMLGSDTCDQTDSDGDGTVDCNDGCPNDDAKGTPGVCGCGVADVDGDGDGILDCRQVDLCPDDDAKDAPGVCGCGVADLDSDDDGTFDCRQVDLCPYDDAKDTPGICGCGVADVDRDGDGTLDCRETDLCPDDDAKDTPGVCGCRVADLDSDGDGDFDCQETDLCPDDEAKGNPGICGCGVADLDSDQDGISDCNDGCPNDESKDAEGICGCGVAESDIDGDGGVDCGGACLNGSCHTPPDDGCGCSTIGRRGEHRWGHVATPLLWIVGLISCLGFRRLRRSA